jgi:tyrosine-protein phosphatase SIW14
LVIVLVRIGAGADLTHFLSRYFLSVVLAFLLPTAAFTQAGHSNLLSLGIGNFGGVDQAYYRGSQPDANDYADLASLGIRTVIDLQRFYDPAEQMRAENAGMKFERIPLATDRTPTEQEVAKFLALVNDPANQPVYVHCFGGIHRTGVMTAVYRMTRNKWTAEQAFTEMQRYHFGEDHPHLKEFVYNYRPPR